MPAMFTRAADVRPAPPYTSPEFRATMCMEGPA